MPASPSRTWKTAHGEPTDFMKDKAFRSWSVAFVVLKLMLMVMDVALPTRDGPQLPSMSVSVMTSDGDRICRVPRSS